jgi:hypothetical protein
MLQTLEKDLREIDITCSLSKLGFLRGMDRDHFRRRLQGDLEAMRRSLPGAVDRGRTATVRHALSNWLQDVCAASITGEPLIEEVFPEDAVIRVSAAGGTDSEEILMDPAPVRATQKPAQKSAKSHKSRDTRGTAMPPGPSAVSTNLTNANATHPGSRTRAGAPKLATTDASPDIQVAMESRVQPITAMHQDDIPIVNKHLGAGGGARTPGTVGWQPSKVGSPLDERTTDAAAGAKPTESSSATPKPITPGPPGMSRRNSPPLVEERTPDAAAGANLPEPFPATPKPITLGRHGSQCRRRLC